MVRRKTNKSVDRSVDCRECAHAHVCTHAAHVRAFHSILQYTRTYTHTPRTQHTTNTLRERRERRDEREKEERARSMCVRVKRRTLRERSLVPIHTQNRRTQHAQQARAATCYIHKTHRPTDQPTYPARPNTTEYKRTANCKLVWNQFIL